MSSNFCFCFFFVFRWVIEPIAQLRARNQTNHNSFQMSFPPRFLWFQNNFCNLNQADIFHFSLFVLFCVFSLFCIFLLLLLFWLFLFRLSFSVLFIWHFDRIIAAGSTRICHSNEQTNIQNSNIRSIRFNNGVPHHSDIDLNASCPKCLAAAADKPNGSDGEFC